MNGLLSLGAGLLASAISSFLSHFAAGDLAFVRGVFDGLAVGAFAVGIYHLVRARRAA